MKDDEPTNRKRRPFYSETGNIPRRTKYFKSKNKYLLGTIVLYLAEMSSDLSLSGGPSAGGRLPEVRRHGSIDNTNK